MYTLYKFHFLNGISEINQLFDDILIIWPAPVYTVSLCLENGTVFFFSLSISQSDIIWYYDNLALNDDRMLVIRITKYKCIFVMLTELRSGGGA